MGDTFAPPLSKLGDSGIGVAATPSGGKGLALNATARVPETALIEPWKYVSDLGLYQNSWSDGGSGILRVRFRKVAGIVFMEGQPTRASAPSQDTVMFGPLPTGYWPQNTISFLVPDVGASTPSITQVKVDFSGVKFSFTNAGAGALFPHVVLSYTPHLPTITAP